MEPQDTPLQRGMMNLAFGPRKVFESLEAIASEDPSESGRDFHNHPENRKVSEFESKLESKSTRSMKTERERERMELTCLVIVEDIERLKFKTECVFFGLQIFI